MAGKRAVVVIMLILAGGNGVWASVTHRTAPWPATDAYAVVAFTVLRRKDYRAGLIVGILGFAIHTVELAGKGKADLGPIESAWLVANTILPLVLVFMSYTIVRRARRSGVKTYEDGPKALDD